MKPISKTRKGQLGKGLSLAWTLLAGTDSAREELVEEAAEEAVEQHRRRARRIGGTIIDTEGESGDK